MVEILITLAVMVGWFFYKDHENNGDGTIPIAFTFVAVVIGITTVVYYIYNGIPIFDLPFDVA